MDDTRDLVILGGGLVGMACALAAAHAGLSSHVIDVATPEALTAPGADGRASAISSASWNLFSNLGLAEALGPLGCPIDAIAVTDQHRPGRIDFRPTGNGGSLGRMFANRDLRLGLLAAACAEPLIALNHGMGVAERVRGPHGVTVTLADGSLRAGRLLIAAEGRQSPTRVEEGIPLTAWAYNETAVVAGLTHEQPHANTAWEIFFPTGPFALLPLLDDAGGCHRSALVWTVPSRHAAGVMAMGERGFLAEIAARMDGLFGAITLAAPPMAYPLRFQHATRLTGDRLALIGDAAHGMHPIAGQGLNLGLRDVGALIQVLSEGARLGLEPGDAQLLARYERWRALDNLTTMAAMDGIVRLFRVPGRLPSAARRLGMAAVQRSGSLKGWFMAEARGLGGTLPALLAA